MATQPLVHSNTCNNVACVDATLTGGGGRGHIELTLETVSPQGRPRLLTVGQIVSVPEIRTCKEEERGERKGRR